MVSQLGIALTAWPVQNGRVAHRQDVHRACSMCSSRLVVYRKLRTRHLLPAAHSHSRVVTLSVSYFVERSNGIVPVDVGVHTKNAMNQSGCGLYTFNVSATTGAE